MTEFLDGLCCDLFCLFDFHDLFSLFRGALLPSQDRQGANEPKQRTEVEWVGRRGGMSGTCERHSFFVARNVLMETAAEVFQSAGRVTLETAGIEQASMRAVYVTKES
jgi:hypothetical protein